MKVSIYNASYRKIFQTVPGAHSLGLARLNYGVDHVLLLSEGKRNGCCILCAVVTTYGGDEPWAAS